MSAATRNYERAGLNLRIARARLLHQIARPDVAVGDLLRFARIVGDETQADSLAAFRAAQQDALQAAEADLRRLTGPDEGRPDLHPGGNAA